MSASERTDASAVSPGSVTDLLDHLDDAVDAILRDATTLDHDQAEEAVRLLALAAKFYGGLSRTDGAEDMPMAIPSTTTDAATAAAVLILSQNLSLFEFNIWYSRVADAAERQQQGRATE